MQGLNPGLLYCSQRGCAIRTIREAQIYWMKAQPKNSALNKLGVKVSTYIYIFFFRETQLSLSLLLS